MTKSTLIIRDSHARHFGTYNCSVTNLYGSDSVEIRLVPDSKYDIIFVGIFIFTPYGRCQISQYSHRLYYIKGNKTHRLKPLTLLSIFAEIVLIIINVPIL